MVDIFLILVGALLAATAYAAVEYYRQLRKARGEYEKAKGVIDDIVLSFKRQLRQQNERLELTGYKVEAALAKESESVGKAIEASQKTAVLETRVAACSEEEKKTATRLGEIEQKLGQIVTSRDDVATRLNVLEERIKQPMTSLEPNVEAVIPIRREKAMAQLTETELSVLEMLAAEGPKTAPEIKERVKLSREHTARLMKRLYEEGYLERETGKIPFRYSVKKEMEKLLKKTENQPA